MPDFAALKFTTRYDAPLRAAFLGGLVAAIAAGCGASDDGGSSALDHPYVSPVPAWTPNRGPYPLPYSPLDTPEPEHPGCKGWACREQQVIVTYGLEQALGESIVAVEAFDNAHFAGAPVATTSIGAFDASKPGASGKGSVWLKPGRYFLRAYLDSTATAAAPPYTYQGLQLVKDRPVGVFGALSSPTQLDVPEKSEASAALDVAVINLSRLFRDATAPLGTGAHLRFKLAYELCATAAGCPGLTPGTKVVLRLLKSDDLDTAPSYETSLPVEALQVTSHPGHAEVVTAELPLESYVAYAFIDLNGNGFMDKDEPRQITGAWDAPAFLKTKADATPTLGLTLE